MHFIHVSSRFLSFRWIRHRFPDVGKSPLFPFPVSFKRAVRNWLCAKVLRRAGDINDPLRANVLLNVLCPGPFLDASGHHEPHLTPVGRWAVSSFSSLLFLSLSPP